MIKHPWEMFKMHSNKKVYENQNNGYVIDNINAVKFGRITNSEVGKSNMVQMTSSPKTARNQSIRSK